jgi:formylglycine-generating enzyme required for sulfatase activity/tRNA A-37 threonylcarbamoyl transferase component Bud32
VSLPRPPSETFLDTLVPESLSPSPEVTHDAAHVPRASDDPDAPRHPRYVPTVLLGRGGMGDVWRVWDSELQRHVALKVLRAELRARTALVDRFMAEARATARLQHPGIVPVYDVGHLDDGRLFFTMREIGGSTLAPLVEAVHAASTTGAWEPGVGGWTFARLVDGFRRACEAVAHAHARGFVHRDLKPDNIMAGPHGEILVLDWGIAALAEGASGFDDEASGVFLRASGAVQAASPGAGGGVAGTPSWMAPEQARGEPPCIGTDVHALGAVLHAILHGVPPYVGSDVRSILADVRAARRVAVRPERRVPPELHALAESCLAPYPEDRPANADVVAAAIRDWQEGARRRAEADAHVVRAEELRTALEGAREAARVSMLAAREAAEAMPTWRPAAEKAGLWALEDAARETAEHADALEDALVRELDLALVRMSEHDAAHAALAMFFREQLVAAEARRDTTAARRAAERVARHDRAGVHARWLRGDGALSLATDVPARVTLSRVVEVGRRRVPVDPVDLGPTPIRARGLAMGSWLAVVRAEGRPDVQLPIFIDREEHVDVGCLSLPIRNPEGAVFVPGGPCRTGGANPVASVLGRPQARTWVHPFFLDRYPVTNAAWIAFLDDLVAQGREAEALAAVPRLRGVEEGVLLYRRTSSGGFCLVPDAEGDVWSEDWPVILVDVESVMAYAAWRSARDGLRWRLPTEDEWEKAARGADGRTYPWGDTFDASWANVRESHRGRPLPAAVDSFSDDESPYGVRGMAGNVRTLCRTAEHAVVAKGGAWSMFMRYCDAVRRPEVPKGARLESVGVRLACSLHVIGEASGENR